MTPNRVTAVRVAMAFVAVALFVGFGKAPLAYLAAIGLTIAAIALDGLDGYLARTRGLATPLGAQLDVLGDRIVENLFFTFFAVSGLISLWVPIVFFVRGTTTDFLRGLASKAGRTAFGSDSMLEARWARALVGSRASRAAYATLKCVSFCCLGLAMAISNAHVKWLSAAGWVRLTCAGRLLVSATVIFCLVRATPVIWEARRYWSQALKARRFSESAAISPAPESAR